MDPTIYKTAGQSLAQGESPAQVKEQLVATGLAPDDADAVIEALGASNSLETSTKPVQTLPELDAEPLNSPIESGSHIFKFGMIGVGAFAIIVLGTITGLLPFLAATIKCGHLPVIASDFAASYSYTLPGHNGYFPSIFNRYFCSEAEAQAAGYNNTSISSDDAARAEAHLQESAYAPDKVPFTVYSPTYLPDKYKRNIPSDTPGLALEIIDRQTGKQVWQAITREVTKQADGDYILIRQGATGVGDTEAICKDTLATCQAELIGTDSHGHKIYEQNIYHIGWGTIIKGTYINIETDDDVKSPRHSINRQEAIKMFGSMQPAK